MASSRACCNYAAGPTKATWRSRPNICDVDDDEEDEGEDKEGHRRCCCCYYSLGWESRYGGCVAFSLSILEVKRLLLLTFEMLVHSRPIRFADGLLPVVFSFLDAGLGFPLAIASLYAVRKYQKRPCYPKPKRALRRIAMLLAVCAILNVVTIVLIGCRVRVAAVSLRNAFRASMRFYATNASYKAAIDELQLDLQCCGFSSYMDWFAFNWQIIDYSDVEDWEEYVDRSVPFSCCSKRTLLPCVHIEMRIADEKTINSHGCALVLSRILVKVVVVGYAMTSLITFAQILMIIMLIRLIKKDLAQVCAVDDCSCWGSKCPLNANAKNYSSECPSSCAERIARRCRGAGGQERQRQPVQTLLKPRRSFSRRLPRNARSIRCSRDSPDSSSSSTDVCSSARTSSCEQLTSSPSNQAICQSVDISLPGMIVPPADQQQQRPPSLRPR